MLLYRITGPAELKQLSDGELRQLAAELREVIVATVAERGGHLAPSLGTVELTLALHAVLDSPRDKLIWDIGHQAYAHKLVTGRLAAFSTLKQAGGLSGYLRREESPHDTFGAGHAGTSLSAGLGFALARDLRRETHRVVVVIGDGALTAGMALEALNHAGHYGGDLLVVLNDNQMSIARNVGALSCYLSRLRADPSYNRLKGELEQLVRHIPAVGGPLARVADRLKEALRQLVVPGRFFEELGFTYYGPVDGHDIPLLKEIVGDCLARRGPVLLHVLTVKGKGYPPAEADPARFHGLGPFHRATGAPRERGGRPSFSHAFAEALIEFAREDPRIVAITAAMPEGTGLDRFARVFPERFVDVGIAEQHAVTLAAGLAAAGLRPVVALYSTFLQRAYDQVIHDVCLQGLPVVFGVDRAGLVGGDGATHQGAFDGTFLRAVPGLVLMAPRDEDELASMLYTALHHAGPSAIRYPRRAVLGVERTPPRLLPVGRGELLRDGGDVGILAVGTLCHEALAAAEALAAEGIRAAVVNARFYKPLDAGLVLEVARRTGRLVTVEESARVGGFGSGVLEVLADAGVTVPVVRLGLPDTFVEHGDPAVQRRAFGLDAAGIAAAARRLAGLHPVAAQGVAGAAG